MISIHLFFSGHREDVSSHQILSSLLSTDKSFK